MKYVESEWIDRPRDKVVALFDDPENLAKWQEGFVSCEPISGTPGTSGAKARLTYQMGKRRVVMTETLKTRELPDRVVVIYETKNVWNRVENHFEEEDGGTRWMVLCEFRCEGLVMWAMATFLPGMFRRQTVKSMTDFKLFAETH